MEDPIKIVRTATRAIDAQKESLQEAGLRPAVLVLDHRTYQAIALIEAQRKAEASENSWANPEGMEVEAVTEYLGLFVVVIASAETTIRVTCPVQQIWNAGEVFLEALKDYL
ncbi:hypothetical protein CCAX7_56510 [Capsulimonas corticalis]|uniref:Uncharacterized protein n=1 Tax=Capsulimonas corticalis TaxID=2219043 RepID=A0A402D0M6_9BACT|nr:hypothetical protein [Capsulimonas corticalis]BDI33600.1 hypothetical protein CCAX7_56510 [Capsulimonas corticalis]